MTDHQGLTDGGFVEAGTPESEALHVEGSYFAAHHIGGTTWRFGSGDEAKDDLVGTITLAPHGATTYGLANARWIVNALDQVKRQAKEDERRRIDELAAEFAKRDNLNALAADLGGDGSWRFFWDDDADKRHVLDVDTFTEALAATPDKEGTE